MKKVIFICLLSLAVCLSSPVAGDKQAVPPAPAAPAAPAGTPPTEQTLAPSTGANSSASVTVTPGVTEKTPAKDVTPKPEANNQTNKNETSAPGKDDKKDSNITTTIAPANAANQTVTPAPPAKTNSTTPSSAEKTSSTTTTTPASVKPTDTPAKEGDKIVQARGFDGASFIGGIILTLGLLAIGFMGFKYYKNQTERNYHTL